MLGGFSIMAKDYSDIGLSNRLLPVNSLAGKQSQFKTALEDNMAVEPTPYLHRTAISQRGGTIQTNLGGIFEIRDTTGGTVLLTASPTTGVVTISGSLVTQAGINIGTLSNSLISGTTRTTGTITGSAIYSGGTFNNIIIGTSSLTGGTIDSVTMGTPTVTGGIVNSAIFGTPTITNGTMNNATFGTPNTQSGTFGTPTIIRPTIDGTVNFDTSAGSATLGVSGDFAIQTHTGSAILVARLNGTTFYFTSAGTLA